MTVFVDTSALYALLDAKDPAHPRAQHVFAELQKDTTALLTTSYVVIESVALLQRRAGIHPARMLHDRLVPLLDMEWIDPATHEAAMTALLSAGRRGISLVDWTSFLVMRRQGLEVAFAFDDDFERQGFRVLG